MSRTPAGSIRLESLTDDDTMLAVAGQAFAIRPFGLYATESMRLEKGYRHWKADLITEYNPFESRLERFVVMDKDVIGRTALQGMHEAGPRRRFATMEIATDEAPAQPGDAVVRDRQAIGTITSAGWGYRVAKNLAMAFVAREYSEVGSTFSVEILGETFPARVRAPGLYDPENLRVRS